MGSIAGLGSVKVAKAMEGRPQRPKPPALSENMPEAPLEQPPAPPTHATVKKMTGQGQLNLLRKEPDGDGAQSGNEGPEVPAA